MLVPVNEPLELNDAVLVAVDVPLPVLVSVAAAVTLAVGVEEAVLVQLPLGVGLPVPLGEGLTIGAHLGLTIGRSQDGSTCRAAGGAADAGAPKHVTLPRRLTPHANAADAPDESASSRLALGTLNEAGGTIAPCDHAPVHVALPLACRKQL